MIYELSTEQKLAAIQPRPYRVAQRPGKAWIERWDSQLQCYTIDRSHGSWDQLEDAYRYLWALQELADAA